MGGFFNIDGPFFRVGNIMADMLMLSLLWILFSLPVITMGASTAAVFYVVTRRIANREGYIAKDFWKSFKMNFKNATIIWVLTLLLALILIFNLMNIEVMENMTFFMRPLQYFLLIELCLINIYVYPIMSRFDMGFFETLKSAFFMSNRHLLTSLACLAMIVVLYIALFRFPYLIFAFIGLYSYPASLLIMRTFRKYRPDIDKKPETEENA
ncbi:MAG: YesL family protein [Defluviitaleaceae bacterium]|nr:YesL family protein [Defluviitaleaceae bacterium]